jgi:hypothetical protein
MYKVAYVSGNTFDISSTLRQTIEGINQVNGEIVQIVQSQSSHQSGHTIITITIIYTTRR